VSKIDSFNGVGKAGFAESPRMFWVKPDSSGGCRKYSVDLYQGLESLVTSSAGFFLASFFKAIGLDSSSLEYSREAFTSTSTVCMTVLD
jgi:hypothetical protein